jgi:hypothetical protein
LTHEQQESGEKEVILRDNKKVLCEKLQFDIEISMGKDCDEQVVEEKVFVDFRKEEKKP